MIKHRGPFLSFSISPKGKSEFQKGKLLYASPKGSECWSEMKTGGWSLCHGRVILERRNVFNPPTYPTDSLGFVGHSPPHSTAVPPSLTATRLRVTAKLTGLGRGLTVPAIESA